MKKPAGLMCPPLTLPETRIPIITPRPPDKHPGRNKFISFNDFIFYSREKLIMQNFRDILKFGPEKFLIKWTVNLF